VSGTVSDEAGMPLPGAAVNVGIGDPRRNYPYVYTTTNAAGQFTGSLPAGTYPTRVSKPGYQERSGSVTIAGDVMFDVTLVVGITVSGWVREVGVEGALRGATVEITSGPSKGLRSVTGPGSGAYSMKPVMPGDFTVQASKEGYETIQRSVHAEVDTSIDFDMKWAYGTCLQSVTPIVFSQLLSTGETATVFVAASAGRQWSAAPDSSWIEVVSGSPQIGSGQMVFRVLPNTGAHNPRSGALMIRCSAAEGQNVWITQSADCQITLQPVDPSTVFPPAGGSGHLFVHTNTPNCHWTANSEVEWIRTVGIRDWTGDLGIYFSVQPNTSGAVRTGTLLVGDTAWTVTQR
jgi:hypothetical protein